MVKSMGWFDQAINEKEDHLEHGRFGSFRKNHKYVDRVWKGGRWVYKYAKQAAGKAKSAVDNADHDITGSAYKKEAEDEKRRAEYANELGGSATKNVVAGRNVDDVKNGPTGQYANYAFKSSQNWADSAQYHGRKAAEAESNYYNKSLAGKAEKTAKNLYNKAKSAVSTTTGKVTDRQTGETKSVNPNGAFYQALEKESKKKKIKHDDLHECVALGEQILNDLLGG